MRILVATTHVPFVFGGAEVHANSLVEALRRTGHEAELVSIPFRWYPPEKILDHLLACRLLDLTESNGVKVDRVIGLKFPAYHVPHPNKILWVLHQYRTAFDLWNTPECDLAYYPEGREYRDTIAHLEIRLLHEAQRIFANSQNVANRLREFSKVDAPPLYHPPQDAEQFYSRDAEDFLFYPSRLCGLKRQELVIEALARTRQPVVVHFAGKPDNPAFLEKLRRRAKQCNLGERVRFLGMISNDDKRDLYARCAGVVFPPQDEDYGYITLEAMLASKPVVTCTDSGGPLEFVQHENSGLIADPNPDSLAAGLDRLWKERAWAREAGVKGRRRIDELGINWPNVVSTLLQ